MQKVGTKAAPASPSGIKKDNLTPGHLSWLVNSRTANQRSALWLFTLFETYAKQMRIKENKPISIKAQTLVSICFSLWRAAFLADKTGERDPVLTDARTFLGKMLTNNAITYPEDRSNREWTFNYYMNNAREGLLALSVEEGWSKVERAIRPEKAKVKGSTPSTRRWDRHQKAFETALEMFEGELKGAAGSSFKKKVKKTIVSKAKRANLTK